MSAVGAAYKTARQKREWRLTLVGELYKKGWSYRKIARELETLMGLPKPPALRTIQTDVTRLLEEWRSARIENVDHVLQLELERIDDAVSELWEAWEKSKTDHTRTDSRRKGVVVGKKVNPAEVQKIVREEINFGDPRYISEIRKQLAERRKLLGLYAPEKKEISGDLSFAHVLAETGLLDDGDDDSTEESEGNG